VRLAKEIAPLRIVRAAFGFPLPPGTANVRWAADLEGGALMDVGCYCVNALRLLCGEPEHVVGEAVAADTGVDVRFAGVLRLPGDVLGTIDCGLDVPPRGGIYVVGAGGTLIAEDPWHGVTPRLTLMRQDADPEEIPVEAVDPYRLELEDVSAAIRNGGDPRLGRADAVGQARTIEALYASALR
jgi:xylose dehydrogenase (NAD/NADP)